MPEDDGARARAICWLFAALNSVEPFLQEIAIADAFIEDKKSAEGSRAFAVEVAKDHLGKLSTALGDSDWLVGDDFSIADLMMATVMKIVRHTQLVETHDNLTAWRDRCFARPAYKEALAEQYADFEHHGPEDMGWDTSLAEPDGNRITLAEPPKQASD